MSNKALITRRPETAPEPARASVLPAVQATGVVPEAETPSGTLVRGTEVIRGARSRGLSRQAASRHQSAAHRSLHHRRRD